MSQATNRQQAHNKVGQILKMDFKDQESVPSSSESIVIILIIMESMPKVMSNQLNTSSCFFSF